MRTTLSISDALLDEVRRRAAQRHQPFRAALEEMIQLGLAADKAGVPAVRVRAHPVGVKAAYRGMSMNQLYDQIESERLPKVADQ